MDKQECEICSKMVKEKYKHYKTWRNLAIVFISLTVLFAILYFGSGDLLSSMIVEYNNDVTIENGDDNNTNANNGNIVIEKKNDSTGSVVLLSALILSGGILGGCYVISQVSHNNKQQSDN